MSFLTAPTYIVEGLPTSVTVGDLDGDGDLDLATANSRSYNVSVLKNNGNGTFAAPQNFAVGDSPSSITIGHLDTDGNLDLAVANSGSNNVSVLKNNGNGTFATAQNFAVGDSPCSIAVGDLDGDGDLDLATANYRSNDVSVLKNNGNGTFATVQNFAVEGSPSSITVGDLDGDQDLDLATGNFNAVNNYLDSVSALENNGDGTFALPRNYSVQEQPSSIAVGDLDRDGDLDLATANQGSSPYFYGTVSVLKNNGDGTFATYQSLAIGDEPSSVIVEDLDRDGDLDLASANGSSEDVSVLKNNGDGTFATAQNFSLGNSPYSITVGDLDGDGDLDFATANLFSYNVSVLKSNKGNTFDAPQNFDTGRGLRSVTAGDLDGDGDLDLATTNNTGMYPFYVGTVSVLENNSNGTFALPRAYYIEDRPRAIVVGDLDRDGDLDIATADGDYNSNVSVLKNNGNGTFATAQSYYVRGGYPQSITVGDLDRDGDPDLVTANNANYPDDVGLISVLKNNGDGTFATAQDFSVEYELNFLIVGDLDGDGDLDIATASETGYPDARASVLVLKNNGDGTFAAPQSFALGEVPRYMTVGDLDGDGDLDLAVTNGSSYSVYVLKNNGNGTFATAQKFAIEGRNPSITVGDLDGDGDLDLVTGTSVLKNNGDGTFGAAQPFDGGSSITVGDFDKDGDLDLAVKRASEFVTVLQNTTPTLQLSPSTNRADAVPLAGQTVSGNIYIFASGKDTDFKRVQFYLDDPQRSSEPIRLERSAPFDFAGGTNMDPTITQANAFDTRTLTNGEHTITATFARTNGTFLTITSTFTISN